MKLKKKMILKEKAQSFISQAEESNIVLFISFLWEGIRDKTLRLQFILCYIYIGIYKIGCNIYTKKVSIERL